MASISSLGIGSGLLTADLADDIIAAERAPTELRLDNEQALTEAKISAFGEIVSSLSSFDSALQSLSLASTFNANTATSTNDAFLTATASSVSTSGNYTVEVSQLAANHSVASGSYTTLDSVVGTGVLTFRIGTITFDGSENYQSFALNTDAQTKTITIDSTNNTLSGIRDAVNVADFGVQASIIDDGSGFRLLFTSEEGGVNNSLEVVASGTDGIKALNYSLASETANLNAVTAAGTLDLSSGANLAGESRAFSLSYNGTQLDVVVPITGGAIDTTTAVAAVQTALDSALVTAGFTAGDVIAAGTSDKLSFSTLASGFSTTLQINEDGSNAKLTAGSALATDGYLFGTTASASFTIEVDNGGTNVITLSTDTLTYQGTVDLINTQLTAAGLNTQVVASLSASNEVIFTAVSAGTASEIDISAPDANAITQLGLTATVVNGLDGFGLDDAASQVTGSVRLSQTVKALDANFTVNGLAITRNSNVVAGVVGGTTLTLKGVTTGPVTITVAKDPGSLTEKIQAFVDAYNELKVIADTLTSFDADAGDNGIGSILIGDSTLRTVTSKVDSILRSAVTGLTGSVRTLAEIGITTDQNNDFTLSFNTSVFDAKFASNPEDILALFATAGSTTDAQIKYSTFSSESQAGTYSVDVTNLATVGTYKGFSVNSLGTGNIVIDSNNDTFTINVNGISTAVTLTQATYVTASSLADQIQTQINSDDTLSDGGHAVTVTYDSTNKRFDLASNVYGANSTLSFTTLDTNTASTLGFVLATQGPFEGNQLAGLSTPNGSTSENFDTAVTLAADSTFVIGVNGVNTSTLTLTAQSYATPDLLIAEIEGKIAADPALQAKVATTAIGSLITAGQDFSATNHSITFSLDGGSTTTTVLVNTPSSGSTVNDALADIQTAIDAADAGALSGKVQAFVDNNDKIYFATVATGVSETLQVTADGSAAVMTSTALASDGFNFNGTSTSFDITIDGETLKTISVDTNTTDYADTIQKVQDSLDAAGIGTKVTASLGASNELVLTRVGSLGTTSAITIANLQGEAADELGLSVGTDNGLAGFTMGNTNYTGADAVNVNVDYSYDSVTKLGRLTVDTGDSEDVIAFTSVSTVAANTIGFFVGDGTVTTTTTGLNVGGKINGITAIGSGQFLRAEAGNTPAKPGFYLNAAFGNLASSTAGDSFKVTVDGITSSAITLGTITNTTPSVVAAGIQTAINADVALLAAGVSVVVEYDVVTGGFGIISDSTGPTSSVTISSLVGNAGTLLGFVAGAGAKGGTGSSAKGSPDPSSGIKVEVTGGALGSRGTVSFIRGVADQLSTLLDSFLGSGGLLTNKTAALNVELADIAEERLDLDARIAASEEQLRASFLANDLIIASLNTTSDFLTSQLKLLEGLISSSNND